MTEATAEINESVSTLKGKTRAYTAKLRLEVFTHYCGGPPRCQCPGCNTTYIEFLQLDHVTGNGAMHRKENNLGTGGARLWRWVRANGYPAGFQVLCRNCNGAKFNRPQCPLHGRDHI
jgi:hypothetical protein